VQVVQPWVNDCFLLLTFQLVTIILIVWYTLRSIYYGIATADELDLLSKLRI